MQLKKNSTDTKFRFRFRFRFHPYLKYNSGSDSGTSLLKIRFRYRFRFQNTKKFDSDSDSGSKVLEISSPIPRPRRVLDRESRCFGSETREPGISEGHHNCIFVIVVYLEHVDFRENDTFKCRFTLSQHLRGRGRWYFIPANINKLL